MNDDGETQYQVTVLIGIIVILILLGIAAKPVVWPVIQWFEGEGMGVIIAGVLALIGVPMILRHNARRQEAQLQQQLNIEKARLAIELRDQIVTMFEWSRSLDESFRFALLPHKPDLLKTRRETVISQKN